MLFEHKETGIQITVNVEIEYETFENLWGETRKIEMGKKLTTPSGQSITPWSEDDNHKLLAVCVMTRVGQVKFIKVS